MKKFAIIYAVSFLLSLVTSLGQGFFYMPRASPAEGGTIKESIVSRAEDAIVEHYEAVPAPGYYFDSWSLQPRGAQRESLYVHTYDPRLSFTWEGKPITAHFVKENTVTGPVGESLEIRLTANDQMELTFPTKWGSSYIILSSNNLQDWVPAAVGALGDGNDKAYNFPVTKGGKLFYRLAVYGPEIPDNPEVAVSGRLLNEWWPGWPGGSLRIRLWEYDPRIADKGADLFAEKIIDWDSAAQGRGGIEFELGDRSKANPALSYYITAYLYEDGKVGDLESRIYFLGGFNRVTIPGTLSGDIVRIK